MGKNQAKPHAKAQQAAGQKGKRTSVPASSAKQKPKSSFFNKISLPPVWLIFTVLVFIWAAFYYSAVFQVSREHSFWSTDSRTMQYFMTQPHAWLRYIGRAALTLYHSPILGGLILTITLGCGSALLGYILRAIFKAKSIAPNAEGNNKKQKGLLTAINILQFLPALVYIGVVTELGLDAFFEAETGYILGIPMLVFVILCFVAIGVKLLTRFPLSSLWKTKGCETRTTYLAPLATCVILFAGIVLFGSKQRAYVRPICQAMLYEQAQDWDGIQDVARANAQLSNRIMATYYAAALVHTDQVGSRVYDIRLEYDTLRIHGMDGHLNNGINMYLQEGNYHAGLVETCYHSCMEQMVMTGPNLRLLKLMTKCALMREEWELARKYLRILRDVPFEGDFCEKYSAMLHRTDLVNADKEMAKLRELEPVEDTFENQHQNPTFMGYNLNLTIARSMAGWNNSMAVCLYTKLLPQFAARLEPYIGQSLPENFADGAILASRKFPEIVQAFPSLQMRANSLESYIQSIQPYMDDRPKYGPELFPEQKGYYPHYYFFGNLRATKPGYTGESASRSGVN